MSATLQSEAVLAKRRWEYDKQRHDEHRNPPRTDRYAIADRINRDLFFAGQQYRSFDSGKGIAGYRKFDNPSICQGTYFILLSNDNSLQGIDATVKVVAIIETNVYEDKQYTEMNILPRYEKKTFSDPVIKTSKVPVIGK